MPSTKTKICLSIVWPENNIYVTYRAMNSRELKRYLANHGCTFDTRKGTGGHVTAFRGKRSATLPMHGSRKELKTGLVNAILKDLGLK